MPQNVTITIYKFNELSDNAKEVARDWYRDINDDNEYAWENTKEDASTIGLTLLGQDSYRSLMNGKFDGTDAIGCALNIQREHGKDCETYKTAMEFISKHDEYYGVNGKITQGILCQFPEYAQDELEAEFQTHENEFLKSLCENYRIMYEKDIEYKQSDEVIDEQLECNEYDFTVAGKRFK